MEGIPRCENEEEAEGLGARRGAVDKGSVGIESLFLLDLCNLERAEC